MIAKWKRLTKAERKRLHKILALLSTIDNAAGQLKRFEGFELTASAISRANCAAFNEALSQLFNEQRMESRK